MASRVSPRLSGSLTVFAAASLTEAFNATKSVLESARPALSLSYNFAGSQQLVMQVEAGAPADVVATADTSHMDMLRSKGLVGTPVVMAQNLLEIAVAPGNPRHVRGLSDLSNPDLKVVLADPSVPAGRFARQALAKAGVSVRPVSEPLDVKAVLQTVETGNADAAIVYLTDVRSAGGQVQGVAIPTSENVLATYPIAVVSATRNRPAAEAFVAQEISGPGASRLRAFGFLPP